MKNKNVCHQWAHKTKERGRQGNVYFEDGKIFSYGSHFCCAKHATDKRGKPCVLFTTRDYSSTTGQHKSAIRSSIPPALPVFYMEHPENEPTQDDVKKLAEGLANTRESIMRKTKDWKWSIELLDEKIAKLEEFAHAFKLKFKDKPSKEWKAFLIALQEKIQKQENREQWLKDHPTEANLAAEKRRTAALRLKQAKFEREAGEWFAGTRNQFPATPGATQYSSYRRENYLRVNPRDPTDVESNHNAHAPLKHVLKAWSFIKQLWEEGKEWSTNGHTVYVGNYKLDSIKADGVRAGCHFFAKSEVLRFAKVIGG